MASSARATAAVVVGLSLVAAFGCSRQKPPEPPPRQRAPLRVEVKRSEVEQSDSSGRLMWKISAGNIKLDELTQNASVDAGRVSVFDHGKPALEVKFGKLQADVRSRLISASGGIMAEGRQAQTRFSASSIVIDLRTDRVVASGPVEGSNPAGSFKAGSLTTDLKLSRIQLGGPGGVRGTINR